MKEFVEKLIGRLEEINPVDYGSIGSYEAHSAVKDCLRDVERTVNQLAEEYKQCTLCYLQSPCEYQNENVIVPNNNGWIPCSERLPEESELVLIYAESRARGGSIRVVGHLHNGFWFAQTSSNTLGLTGIGQFNVIAWMPLPEPFKPSADLLKGE